MEKQWIAERIAPVKNNDEGYSPFSLDNIIDESSSSGYVPSIVDDEPAKRKRGRPRKDESDVTIIKAPNKVDTPLNSNITYSSTYGMTNMLLGNSIQQIDELSSKIKQDLDLIRSKSYKQKYEHICQLSGTMTGLMGDKIMAIREMNNTITTCHKLEMGKVKELKLNENVDDDKRLMELYNAYINAPIGTLQQQQQANSISPASLNMPSQIANQIMINPNNQITENSTGYDSYMQNLSPEQHAMMFENNPNVETILVYDQTSHQKYFECVNTLTGETIPNMPLPSQFVLEDCNIDIRNGVAKNVKLNKTWKIKLIGTPVMNEY